MPSSHVRLRLSDGGRRRRLVAVVPGSVEISLLEELAGEDMGHLAECLSSGMLTPTGAASASDTSSPAWRSSRALTPDRRISLNEAAFRALADRSATPGPQRARPSRGRGGEREAVSVSPGRRRACQWSARIVRRRTVRAGAELPRWTADADRLSLLERYVTEPALTGRYADSIEAGSRRSRSPANSMTASGSARTSSRVPPGEHLARTQTRLAEKASREAIEILERAPAEPRARARLLDSRPTSGC